MPQKLLVNRKTGKEFRTQDPESLLKKYPRTFYVKPGTQLLGDVVEKDREIASESLKDIDVIIEQEEKELKKMTRGELEKIAKSKGLDPSKYSNKNSLIGAIKSI